MSNDPEGKLARFNELRATRQINRRCRRCGNFFPTLHTKDLICKKCGGE